MSEDKKPEEGKYWYTDTEFPGMKVRMDGIREFVIDANLGLSDAQIERLMNGVGYWFLKRASIMFPSPAASPVSDAVYFADYIQRCVIDRGVMTYSSLKEAIRVYNETMKRDSPTPTNVQEQDELWDEIVGTVMSNKYSYTVVCEMLKKNYSINKK